MRCSRRTSPKSRLLRQLRARRWVPLALIITCPPLLISRNQVTEQIAKYFAENPNASVFAGKFDVQGDRAIMKAAIDYGNKNNKSIYVFSVDTAKGQVAHQNFVPKELVKSKKLDAKTWLGEVSKLVGGKVSLAVLSVRKRVALTMSDIRAEARTTARWDPVAMSTSWTRPSSERSTSTTKRSAARMLRALRRALTSCRTGACWT